LQKLLSKAPSPITLFYNIMGSCDVAQNYTILESDGLATEWLIFVRYLEIQQLKLLHT